MTDSATETPFVTDPSPAEVEFVNLTSVPLAVFAADPVRFGPPLALLDRGRRVALAWREPRSLTICDTATMTTVVEATTVRGGDTVYVYDEDLRAPRWRTSVAVTFRNSTPHDTAVFMVDDDGRETAAGSCPAGCYVRLVGDTGMWRVKTAADGLLLTSYLAGNEPEQQCQVPNNVVGFENDTLLTVTVARIEEDGAETVMATVPPMQHCLQANFGAWRWVVRDAAGGTELQRIGRQYGPQTNKLSTHDLRTRRTGDTVRLTLLNANDFPVALFEVDRLGRRQPREVLESHGMLRVETAAGRLWVATPLPARRGLTAHHDIAQYFTADEADQTLHLLLRSHAGGLPTVVKVVNTTTLVLWVSSCDERGVRQPRVSVGPGGVASLETTVSTAFVVADGLSSSTVAAFIAKREQPVTRITSASLRSTGEADPTAFHTHLTIENTTPCRVDVVRVGADGKPTVTGTLEPGAQTTGPDARMGDVWQLKEAGTHHNLADFIAGPVVEQAFRPTMAGGSSDIPTVIDFVNRTPLTVRVRRFDTGGDEVDHAELAPRQSCVAETFVGTPWIVRDDNSNTVLTTATGTKRRSRVQITSRHLHPQVSGPSVTVEVINATSVEVQYRLVLDGGGDRLVSVHSPGDRTLLQVTAGQPLRFVSPAFESEIGLFIPTEAEEQAYTITDTTVRTQERPDRALQTGEVALYDMEDYAGNVWILDAGTTDFRSITRLNDAPASVRVGPNTGATLFSAIDHGGDALDVYMDLPKLPAPLGLGTASSLLTWTIESPGDVGLSSRSILTEEYRLVDGAKPEPIPVYRTIITVPVAVKAMDVWGTAEVEITVEGRQYTIDPTRPVRLAPNRLSRVVITMPAESLDTPGLLVRTNTMRLGEKVPIFPDAQAHQKVAALPDGAMHRDRAALGIRDYLTEENIGDVQRAMSNIASTVQYSPTTTPNGIHHTRSFSAAAMEHLHWELDLSGDAPVYSALSADQVRQRTAGARLLETPVAQDFLGIGGFFSGAGSIVVHTVTNVATDIGDTTKSVVGDVVDTTENIGRQVVGAAHSIGNDLVHGNIGRGFVDLGNGVVSVGVDAASGVAHVGGDIAVGALKVGGDVASGAKQLVVITVKFATDAVQIVLDHTGFVGEFLKTVLDKIGAVLGKFVGWLLSKIGWGDVLTCHDGLIAAVNNGFDAVGQWMVGARQGADRLFTSFEDRLSTTIDELLRSAGVPPVQPQDALGSTHSEAMDKLEWLLSLWTEHSSDTASPFAALTSMGGAGAGGEGPVDVFLRGVQEAFGPGNTKINAALASAEQYLVRFFSSPTPDPEMLLGVALELVKAVGIAFLEIGRAVVDTVLDLVAGLLDSLKSALNATIDLPFISTFYSGLTDGNDLTVLSFTCLLAAIPATIFSNAIGDRPLSGFAIPAAQELPVLKDRVYEWGIVYGTTKLTMSVMSPLAEAQTAASREVGGVGAFVSDAAGLTFGGINFALGLLTQFAGCPVGYPDFTTDFESDWDSPVTLPDYLSHVAWHVGWATTGVSAIAQGLSQHVSFKATAASNASQQATATAKSWWADDRPIGIDDFDTIVADDQAATRAQGVATEAEGSSVTVDNVVALLTTVFGFCSLGMMAALDRSYRSKDSYYDDHEPAANDEDGRTFREWVGEGGIWREGFGNVIGTFPDIAAIGAAPVFAKSKYSLAATAAVEFVGHAAEGITYLVRIKRREII